MTLINALALGIVEGLTEFLPISSTAHLILTSRLLKISQTEFNKFFEVFIQSGAILAVVFLYYKLVVNNKELVKQIIVSFLPTAIIGLILYKIIKDIFFNSFNLIIFSFFIVGLVFLIIEYLIKKNKIKLNKNLNNLTIKQSFFIGLSQALAVIPGVSRAGIIMVVMMSLGYKRKEAALYSFLLAVPTILAASALDLLKTDIKILTNSNNLILLIIGFIFSFLSASVVVKWFISFLQNKDLKLFAFYRMTLSLIFLFIK